MADPFGTNITAEKAEHADGADPNIQDLKLGQRVRQLRIDVDGIDENAASTAQVLAALADTADAKDMGGGAVTNVGNVDGVDVSAVSLSNMPAAPGGNIDASDENVINVNQLLGTAAANLVIGSGSQAVQIQQGGTDVIRISGAGNLGFFNTTPVAQQDHIDAPTDEASNTTAITAILTALENLGLIADS